MLKLCRYTVPYSLALLIIMGCSGRKRIHYSNGTILKTITWHVPLEDSLKVLKSKNGIWILPKIDSTNKISYTYYRKPEKSQYAKLLGDIDQEDVSSNDTNIVRYYRFDNKGRRLLGYTAPDPAKPLVMFDPPLLIQPVDQSEHLISSSLMKTWDRNEFDKGLKTKSIISPKGTGYYLNEKGSKTPGILYKLTITSDASIQYGKNNLTVPDAIALSSNILASQNGNLVLEWGIRAVRKDKNNGIRKFPDSLFIEVTEYRKMK